MNASRWLVSSVVCALVSACTLPGNIDDASVRQVEDTGVEDVPVEDVVDVTTDRPVFDAGGPDAPSPTDTGVDVSMPTDTGVRTCVGMPDTPRLISPIAGSSMLSRSPIVVVRTTAGASVDIDVSTDRMGTTIVAMASGIAGSDGLATITLPMLRANTVHFWRARATCMTTTSSITGRFRAGTRPTASRLVERFEIDTDGDGVSEMLVGTTSSRGSTPAVPVAFLYENTTLMRSFSANAAETFGSIVANATDLDGDGYTDIAIAAPYADVAPAGSTITNGGQIFVFFGSAIGVPASTTTTITGERNNQTLGYRVFGLGDVNGDGYGDLAVVQDPTAQRVVIYFGSATARMGFTSAITLIKSTAAVDFGDSIAAGDFNGDGRQDVAVGVAGDSAGAGAVDIYVGTAAGIDPNRAQRLTSTAMGRTFGEAVAVGDVLGDAIRLNAMSIIVGLRSTTNGTGALQVFNRPMTSPTPSATVTAGGAGDYWGWRVASLGDCDNDGVSELAVGAYLSQIGGVSVGRVALGELAPAGLGFMFAEIGSGSGQMSPQLAVGRSLAGICNFAGTTGPLVLAGANFGTNPGQLRLIGATGVFPSPSMLTVANATPGYGGVLAP